MKNVWEGSRVFITGVCGTVGRELLKQVVALAPLQVIGIDSNESAIYFLADEYQLNKTVRLFVGDIRDKESLLRRMKGVDILLHAAAFKHVHLCEESPMEAVKTNIIGSQNIIDAAVYHNVKQVIYTSSDKAVNPTSVMGTTKLMAERLMTAANTLLEGKGTRFSTTRFGNILGSQGSVIPTFKKQIEKGGPLTLTNENMTRFIMSLQEAVELVISSAEFQKGGEVFVTKMPMIRITDLAQVMIEEIAELHGHKPSDIKIKIVGARPGEKLFEELVNSEEARRTQDHDLFFIIQPALRLIHDDSILSDHEAWDINGTYDSEKGPFMNQKELRKFLKAHNLLAT